MKMMNKSVLLSLLFLMACGGPVSREGTKPPMFHNATAAMLKGEDAKAMASFRNFVRMDPMHSYVGDAHYHVGRILVKQGQFTVARREFAKAIEKARRQETQALAKFHLARAYLEDPNPGDIIDNSEEALNLFEEVETDHREIVSMSELLYFIGKCHLQLSDTTQARRYFGRLRSTYGASRWGREVASRGLDSFQDYSVQVAAFQEAPASRQLLQRLRGYGFKAFIHRNKLFCVRVGPFSSFTEAIKEAAKLRRQDFSAILKP